MQIYWFSMDQRWSNHPQLVPWRLARGANDAASWVIWTRAPENMGISDLSGPFLACFHYKNTYLNGDSMGFIWFICLSKNWKCGWNQPWDFPQQNWQVWCDHPRILHRKLTIQKWLQKRIEKMFSTSSSSVFQLHTFWSLLGFQGCPFLWRSSFWISGSSRLFGRGPYMAGDYCVKAVHL